MLVVLDNRDSFTFNLVQALRALGQEVVVRRAAATNAEQVLALRPERIVVGPGPGGPESATTSLELFRREHSVAVLGVCLGHQCLAQAFGGTVARARVLAHGSVVDVHHDGRGLFAGLASPTPFMRYHSLVVDPASLPACLAVSAWDGPDGAEREVMALVHRERPLSSVQFHPESFLSEQGTALLANFLR